MARRPPPAARPQPSTRNMFEDIDFRTLGKDEKCTFCTSRLEPMVANKLCRECRRPICDDCAEVHNRDKRYKNHHFQRRSREGLVMMYCKRHSTEGIKHFCWNCRKAVCSTCKDSAPHSGHDFVTFDEGLTSYRQELTEKRIAMNEQLDCTNEVLKNTSDTEARVQSDFAQARDEIQQRADKIIELVQRWQEEKTNEVNSMQAKEAAIWHNRVHELHMRAAKIKDAAECLETLIAEEDDVKLVKQSGELVEPLSDPLITRKELLEPLQTPTVKFVPAGGSEKGVRKVIGVADLKELLGEVAVHNLNSTYENMMFATLPVRPDKPSDIRVTPPARPDKPSDTRVAPPARADRPPDTRAPPPPTSPTSAPAPRPRKVANETSAQSSTLPQDFRSELNNKIGNPPVPPAAGGDGMRLLWSAEMGNSPGQVCFPIAVGFTQDKNTIVSEAGSKRLQCFDIRGRSKWVYGAQGSEKIEPRGMAISTTDQIYVTDVSKRGIRIIDKHGRAVGTLDNLDLTYPKDISINANGNIVVADKEKRCIVVAASSGRQLKSFGTRGCDDIEFQEPNYVKTDSKTRILVGDTGNMEIKIFNNFGTFIKKFAPMVDGTRQLFHGLAIDTSDNILVAMHDINKVVKFSPDGRYIETVLSGPEVARPATLALTSELIAVAETHSAERHSTVKVFKL